VPLVQFTPGAHSPHPIWQLHVRVVVLQSCWHSHAPTLQGWPADFTHFPASEAHWFSLLIPEL
jgi:hypothetical protein